MRVSVVLTGDEELPGSPLLSARADLVSAAEGSAAALGFEDGDGDPPLAPSDGNRKLFAMLDQASRDLGLGGLEPVDPARAGAADVSFLAGRVPMIVDALGLKGSGGHTVNERANLRTLAWQAKRVAVTLSRIAAAK